MTVTNEYSLLLHRKTPDFSPKSAVKRLADFRAGQVIKQLNVFFIKMSDNYVYFAMNSESSRRFEVHTKASLRIFLWLALSKSQLGYTHT